MHHLFAPPDLPSTFIPWVSGPRSRPFMNCIQWAVLSSAFWLSSTNGRHLQEIGGWEERVQGIILSTPSLPGHALAIMAFLYFLYEVHGSGGQLPQTTAAALSRFWDLLSLYAPLGWEGRGTKEGKECWNRFPLLLVQGCFPNPAGLILTTNP